MKNVPVIFTSSQTWIEVIAVLIPISRSSDFSKFIVNPEISLKEAIMERAFSNCSSFFKKMVRSSIRSCKVTELL